MNRNLFSVFSLVLTLVGFYGSASGQALSDAVDQPTWAFSTNGGAGWSGQTATTHDGVDAAQSGAIADGQSSTFETTYDFPEDGYVTFFWKVSSEEGWDDLAFFIDDMDKEYEWISGEVDWQSHRSRIYGGVHTLRWVYRKDRGCCSGGADAAWVDQVVFVPASQTYTLSIGSTNPASGVAIDVNPVDSSGKGDGTTPFTRTYPVGSWVGLDAPSSTGNYTRPFWTGCYYSTETGCQVVDLYADRAVSVNYLPAGNISGKVSGVGGTALADVEVWVCYVGGDCRFVRTNASGAYSITGLAPGAYKVNFWDVPGYVGEWYDNKPDEDSATEVLVTAGRTTTGIDAVLAPTGSISGRVTGTGGAALQGVDVYAYGPGEERAQTDALGTYRVTGLQAGTYKVHFSDASGYLEQWYDNKPDYYSATEVQVSAGNTTVGIDARLVEGGKIFGTVTGVGGIALKNVVVEAMDSDESSLGMASTGDSGSYTIIGLSSGTYKVQFREVYGYAGEWYDNKTVSTSATAVPVTTGHTTTGVDAVLDPWGRISGIVTGAGWGGLDLAEVSACSLDRFDCRWGNTDMFGAYTIDLPAGVYKVQFRDWPTFSGASLFGGEWYDNKTNSAAANEVVVTAGKTTGGIDARLDPQGGISGTVTGNGGAQLAGVNVLARHADGHGRGVSTDVSGVYSITGLSAGAYKVEFWSNDPVYVGEWYDNKPDQASATEVVVSAGNMTNDINAALSREGIIAGTVSGVGGIGLIGVPVDACPGDGSPCSRAWTRASGGYAIMGLAAGVYKVRFHSLSGYHGEWYDDKPDFASATEVAVSAGNTTGGIDAALIMNTPPVATDQASSTPEDTAQAITLSATDADGDQLTYMVVTEPAHGSISGTVPDLIYHPAADFNGLDSFTFKANDGIADSNIATVSITVGQVSFVLWTRGDTGQVALWQVNPGTGAVLGGVYLGPASGIGAPWQAASYAHVSAAEGYVLWTRSDYGLAALWKGKPVPGAVISGVYLGSAGGIGSPWQATSYAHASDTSGEVLWTRSDTGQAALWTINPGTGAVISGVYLNGGQGIGAPWQAASYTHASAAAGYVLWTRNDTGQAALWKVDPVTGAVIDGVYVNGGQGIGGPWQATSYAHTSDTCGEMLWTRSDTGQAALWTIDPGTGAVVNGVYLGLAKGIGAPWQATSFRAAGIITEMADNIPPTGSILINSGATSTSTTAVILSLQATDTCGSGLASMRFRNNTVDPYSEWEPYQTTKGWTLTGGAGTKKVYVQFMDNAGNISDANPVSAGLQGYSDVIQYTGP